MAIRVFLAIIWFASGWVAGAMAAYVLGLPTGWLPPLVALAAAALITRWSASLRPSVPSQGVSR